MSKNKGIDLNRELRDYLDKLGVSPPVVNRALKDFKIYLDPPTEEIPSYSLTNKDIEELSKKEEAGWSNWFNNRKVEEISIISDIPLALLWEFISYLKSKKDIIEKYEETGSWYSPYGSVVYSDGAGSQEAFIDCLETTEGVKIKDIKQLQKITGITHLVPSDYKGKKPYPDNKAKEEALKELTETLIASKLNRYYRAIETAIHSGATYKDLLSLDPKNWGLPNKWEPQGVFINCVDQRSIINYALHIVFFLEMRFLFKSPSLRKIAEHLEAPLSVIIEAYLR